MWGVVVFAGSLSQPGTLPTPPGTDTGSGEACARVDDSSFSQHPWAGEMVEETWALPLAGWALTECGRWEKNTLGPGALSENILRAPPRALAPTVSQSSATLGGLYGPITQVSTLRHSLCWAPSQVTTWCFSFFI